MDERLRNMSSELRVDVSVTGILAGLTLSASIALFTYRRGEIYADTLLFLTIIASIVFMTATILYASAGGEIRKNLLESALVIMRRAAQLVLIGWGLIGISFIVIGFGVGGILLGTVITAILVICCVYMLWVWNYQAR